MVFKKRILGMNKWKKKWSLENFVSKTASFLRTHYFIYEILLNLNE